ncbi:MAG: ectonucleotide pyrophosphatase/phosphodiesterase [Hyphomonadaceae bacterium]
MRGSLIPVPPVPGGRLLEPAAMRTRISPLRNMSLFKNNDDAGRPPLKGPMKVPLARTIGAALALLTATACASAPTPAASAPDQTAPASVAATDNPADTLTILVSIDGMKPAYIDPENTPTLARLSAQGVHADMRPSFPSVTFPNHYTLVTGLRPDHHGIVNNRMEDPRKPGVVFTIGDRNVASDEFWWDEGTPLWVTAERQNVHAATMFWPGSDYELQGVRPTRWRAFDQSLTDFARVDNLLAWLADPSAGHIAFATLYFDVVDTAGHRYGPGVPETLGAAAQVDAAMARLLKGLDREGYGGRVNLVIVSDHGMAEVKDNQIVDLDPGAPADAAHVVWDGPFAGVTPLPGHETAVETALLGRGEHGQCWRKGELPERFRYGANARVPAIVCLADTGWEYQSSQLKHYPGHSGGAHGFDNADPSMAAVFIGVGPAFKSGVALPTFDNVSVYPLLAKLIGVTPEANDGSLSDTAAGLNP